MAAPAGRRGWAGRAGSLLLALAAAARIFEHYFESPALAVAAALLAAFLLLFLAATLAPIRVPAASFVETGYARAGSPASPPMSVALNADAWPAIIPPSPRAKPLGPAWPRPATIVSALLPHAYFAFQSTLVVVLLGVPPHADFVTALLVALALQAALVFAGRPLSAWVAGLALLAVVPALFVFGALRGLALTLIPAVACVVLPAFVAAYQEIEAARRESQRLLDELQAAQRRLQAYADQAEELAALETLQRAARELHSSVSQTLFSLTLNARAARLYLERDPDRLRPQLERLQSLSQAALAEIRGLIEHLRPPSAAPQPRSVHSI
jgi:signal transduction histidine kinase